MPSVPADKQMEQAVIGAMLVSPHAVETCTEILDPDDFYSPLHRIIFRAVLDLHREGEAIDQLTLTEKLKGQGEYEKVGGRPYIFQLGESVPVSSNAQAYASIVRGHSIKRNSMDAGDLIKGVAVDPEKTPEEVLDFAEQAVYNIRTGKEASAAFADMETLTDDEFAKIQAAYESEEHTIMGLSTGFPDLDKIMLGFNEEENIVVAGQTGMGKTSFALSVVRNITMLAHDPQPVAIFSLEMSKGQLVNRLIAMHSGVKSQKIATGDMDDVEYKKVVKATAAVGSAPIHINDTSGITIASMRPKLRRLAARLQQKGTPLRLIVVDYLGLVTDDVARKEGREKEVSAISRGLKALAREMGIPVLTLSQFSRKADQGQRPQINWLKDAGSIEQDADKVLMIYREDYGDPDAASGVAEVIVGKHRNGPVGVAELAWIETLARFSSLKRER